MSNVTVCARFRPRSSKEMRDPSRDGVCARPIDAETFVFQVCVLDAVCLINIVSLSLSLKLYLAFLLACRMTRKMNLHLASIEFFMRTLPKLRFMSFWLSPS